MANPSPKDGADVGGEAQSQAFPFPTSSLGPSSGASNAVDTGSKSGVHLRRLSRTAREKAKHIRLPASTPKRKTLNPGIYTGSYTRSPRSKSRSARGTPASSIHASPRVSMSHDHLNGLLQDLNLELQTYEVEELRDGFFDASFTKPPKVDHESLLRDAMFTLPLAFNEKSPLSSKHFLPKQWQGIKGVVRAVTTTRSGIQLTKSFLAFFIAYILCLIPAVGVWMGPSCYIMVVSTIINHSGRTVGAQIDGTFLTILGSATGLGWGAFALWLSDSTSVARRGYGGILAAFLVVFMGTIAVLRSYYIRMYQSILSAGIAVIYTCLSGSAHHPNWQTLFNYGIPWLFGQAICLLVCCGVFPDAGARPLAVRLHNAFKTMQDGLVLPHWNRVGLHRQLAWTFVSLSQAYRDLALDISCTRFQPSDILSLRNCMQAVIRSLLSLKMESALFDYYEETWPENGGHESSQSPISGRHLSPSEESKSLPDGISEKTATPQREVVIDIDTISNAHSAPHTNTGERTARLVVYKLSDPTLTLLSCMRSSLAACDAVLMDMSGYRKYLGPPKAVSSDIVGILTKLRKARIKCGEAEDSLMNDPALPPTYSDHPEVVELFLFVHPIRQAAATVEALLIKVMGLQQRNRGWRIYLPSYKFSKGMQRTNAQVRHDRGGLTAGFYFRSQAKLAETMRGMANVYKPSPRGRESYMKQDSHSTDATTIEPPTKFGEDTAINSKSRSKKRRLRYKLWLVLHGLQGFETKFALKVVIATSLLSIPAWLDHSRGWWNEYDCWWAVATVWIMSHPRVGGNFQDLITRAFCAALGAMWGGLAYGAGGGNPFTQSSHPRSGLLGCVSFIVVSLGVKTTDGLPSVAKSSGIRGMALVIGVVAAVVVNWVLWPFVARHELRNALSSMMIYSSIIYRGVVSKYVYYGKGEEPKKEDVEASEILEGRLREGFVRIRQILALTRHEIRLRGPFDPLPYSGLIDACESFFEYLVSVRQSSLFFHPHYMSYNSYAATTLLTYRRDAVAVILMNLYVLAGALKDNRPVPRYLPSAALARKRLLDKMAEVEAAIAEARELERIESGGSMADGQKWSQIYAYSYSQSLTGCVKQLEQLILFTKEIVGEQAFNVNGS
ncbi:putative BRE4 Protein involved in endocytosis [Venustampulla echinocandica]|uniref:Putative BRE4 Protein involved in endocytosis n=1 Tax=Venustampulla echinocandica TaxID=2656787 RepID=A0A370U230_9HELO|nr:putative BRE4 Protein involved in endocytosis [Venustampulla echinocandica]RDL41839.1 putative BRE4 Protein involved in endocytosis [Venustampulla echinocandica]